MFEVGRRYRIVTGLGENEGYSSFEVLAFEAPLLKVKGAGIETIFNTSSPAFVSAEREMTAEERRVAEGEFADF